tara:strand:- start:1309 stop:1563 length:255 start_codon:yes stop_codon:yes gene_type:complete
MSNIINLSEEEILILKKLKEKQSEIEKTVTDLGLLELNLKRRKKNLEDTFNSTLNLQHETVARLNQKYGKGTLDLESFEFHPSK